MSKQEEHVPKIDKTDQGQALRERLQKEREAEIAELYRRVEKLRGVDFSDLFLRVSNMNLHEDVGGSILNQGELLKESVGNIEEAVKKIEEVLANY